MVFSSPRHSAAQHRNVVDAAKRAGVELLAYTSVLHAATSPLALAGEHRATEAAILASGLASTFLRNGWYLENYTAHLAPVLARGAVLGSAGDGRVDVGAGGFGRRISMIAGLPGHLSQRT